MAEGRIKDWIEKLGIEGIEALVRRDTRKAYQFYQGDGETGDRLPARGVRRYAAASKAVFLSFLRKLTPARRLSYLVALFLFARAFFRNE